MSDSPFAPSVVPIFDRGRARSIFHAMPVAGVIVVMASALFSPRTSSAQTLDEPQVLRPIDSTSASAFSTPDAHFIEPGPVRVIIESDGPSIELGVVETADARANFFFAPGRRRPRRAVRVICETPCALQVAPGPVVLVARVPGRRRGATHRFTAPPSGGRYVVRAGARGTLAAGIAMGAVGGAALVGGLAAVGIYWWTSGFRTPGSGQDTLLYAGLGLLGGGLLFAAIGIGVATHAPRQRMEPVDQPDLARRAWTRSVFASAVPLVGGGFVTGGFAF